MKFNLAAAPPDPPPSTLVGLVGNVYRCKGGNKSKYWVIVSVHNRTCVCLGLDDEGNVTSSTNYSEHVFEGFPWSRELIGRAVDMPEMRFNVAWER
jgi:hypothetical protein